MTTATPDSSKLALITGASSGIGAATARHLASEGYRVILVARSAEKLEAVATSIGPMAMPMPCDASDGASVGVLARDISASLGIPDVIVNAAGAGAWKRIEETSPEEAEEMMGAPYGAAFNVTQAFAGGMLARGSGTVVHVGSPASFAPWPSSVGYTAARFALRGLHEALRADLHGSGVHSCHVIFGRVSSPYFDTNANAAARIPSIGRIVRTISPEDCARVIARTIRKPRATVLYPVVLRMFYWLHRVAPGLVRWLLRTTGYRLPGRKAG